MHIFGGELMSQAVNRHFRRPDKSVICFGKQLHYLKLNSLAVQVLTHKKWQK